MKTNKVSSVNGRFNGLPD